MIVAKTIWPIMFKIFYEILLHFYALISLPKLIKGWWNGRYRKSLADRWGRHAPLLKEGSHPRIWIHAVSVGETRAVAALGKLIKKKIPNAEILLTTITETGHAEGKRAFPEADHHLFLPYDFSYIIRPFVRNVRPNLVILSETDFWFNFLDEAKKQGAALAVVNAKISERSARRFSRFKSFSKNLLGKIDLFCVQDEIYDKRLEALGIPSSKRCITGNLKFDSQDKKASIDLAQLKQKLGLQGGEEVLVVGSTHASEEDGILAQVKPLFAIVPNLKVLLVPRHPERFDEVAQLLSKEGYAYGRYSQEGNVPQEKRVVLVDAMGLLQSCFALASVAVVGGSFITKVGGHNILEPSCYGVPVLFGPHMHSQPAMTQLVCQSEGGMQLPLEGLRGALETLLTQHALRQKMGEKGKTLFQYLQGATDRTWQAISLLLNK